ncbi:C40 family peptidase [Intrasporangium sp.]|jgi:cell wall-associated NlpC family hydrolase|uniref:C40 family peptidase n=1 Tax=Intrasporangium sp. TaxID=1925024 RepID=UPI0033655B46
MSSTTSVRGAAARSLLFAPLLAAALALGTLGAPPSSPGTARATTTENSTAAGPVTIRTQPIAVSWSTRQLAVRIAAAQKGDPYRWGAAGPSAFDCSGLVYYVYKTRIGRYIPRTADAQRRASIWLAKSSKQAGDLIFFMSGGRAYHVGIYAGSGRIWHAPRPGQRVQLSTIWTSAYVVGRVR